MTSKTQQSKEKEQIPGMGAELLDDKMTSQYIEGKWAESKEAKTRPAVKWILLVLTIAAFWRKFFKSITLLLKRFFWPIRPSLFGADEADDNCKKSKSHYVGAPKRLKCHNLMKGMKVLMS